MNLTLKKLWRFFDVAENSGACAAGVGDSTAAAGSSQPNDP
jgi:hypothetical protein